MSDSQPTPVEPNSQALAVFNFKDRPIRYIQQNGELLFVASDACAALDIKNVSDAVGRVREKYKTTLVITDSGSNYKHPSLCVKEPGLWQIVFLSRKKQAEEFQDLIYEEVLPSIHKYGCYPPPDVQSENFGVQNTTSLSVDQQLADMQQQLADMQQRLTRFELRLPHSALSDDALENAILKTLMRVGPLTPAKLRSSYLKNYTLDELLDALEVLVERHKLQQFATEHARAKFAVPPLKRIK